MKFGKNFLLKIVCPFFLLIHVRIRIRIATKQFAGDPWRAMPAAVCTAVMHSGPVMIYFGQEIGVDSVGPKGFQGDDGRTTIFDYWVSLNFSFSF